VRVAVDRGEDLDGNGVRSLAEAAVQDSVEGEDFDAEWGVW
jgi:hypothetical protein